MSKLPVVDKAIKHLLNRLDQNDVNWSKEKNNLTSMLSEGALIDRAWGIKLIEDIWSITKMRKFSITAAAREYLTFSCY